MENVLVLRLNSIFEDLYEIWRKVTNLKWRKGLALELSGTAICNSYRVAPREPSFHTKLYSLPRELFGRLEKEVCKHDVHIKLQVTLYRGCNDTIIITHKHTWPSHSPFHQSPSLLSIRILECFCTSQRNRMNQSNAVTVSLSHFLALRLRRTNERFVVTWTTTTAQKLNSQTLKRESHYSIPGKIPVTWPGLIQLLKGFWVDLLTGGGALNPKGL